MASLTEVAHYTRKTLKIGLILIIALIVLRISLNAFKGVWQKLHPPPPPPPTVAFGKLPALVFPQSEGKTAQLSFKLETIQGGLPSLGPNGRVYFAPRKGPNLLALKRATELAQKIGFRNQPQALSATEYLWTSTNTPPTTLTININTTSFQLRYDYQNDPEILQNKNLPNNQQAAQEAQSFLVSNDLLADDLKEGTAQFEYLQFGFPRLTIAASLSEADFVRVNLFRADLEETKILPPNPKESLISFLFSGSRTTGKRIVEINYSYNPIEKEIWATYPLKPITQAWSEVQAGEAYLANLGQNPDNQITIRSVYLAFYDSPQPQHYLQPIYVFEGDRGFYTYVAAIDPNWWE